MLKHFSLGIIVLKGKNPQIGDEYCMFNFHPDDSFSVQYFLTAILSAGKRINWLKANVHMPFNVQNIQGICHEFTWNYENSIPPSPFFSCCNCRRGIPFGVLLVSKKCPLFKKKKK